MISACSSHAPNKNYDNIIEHKVFTSSFIQWNKEYAVTAKHNKFPESPAYVSEDIDLVFFKNKANNTFDSNIEWRNPKDNEKVIHVGPTDDGREVEMSGRFIKADIEFKDGNYAISDSKNIGGMSGGPVYSEDKSAILGMTVGRDLNIQINDVVYKDIAVFVDADTIQSEWNKFQNQ